MQRGNSSRWCGRSMLSSSQHNHRPSQQQFWTSNSSRLQEAGPHQTRRSVERCVCCSTLWRWPFLWLAFSLQQCLQAPALQTTRVQTLPLCLRLRRLHPKRSSLCGGTAFKTLQALRCALHCLRCTPLSRTVRCAGAVPLTLRLLLGLPLLLLPPLHPVSRLHSIHSLRTAMNTSMRRARLHRSRSRLRRTCNATA